MNISLHPKHIVFIEEQIKLGRYISAEELVFVAISLLQGSDAITVDLLRQAIQVDGGQMFDRLQQQFDGDHPMMSLEEMRKLICTDKPA